MKPEIKQYITLDDGIDYRSISKIMSEAGYKMNHATARNVLMAAMNNFVYKISENVGITLNQEKIETILKDQDIHDSFVDILYKAYEEIEGESRKS
jgi:hypothetical protein